MRNPFETEEHQAFRDAVRDFIEREIRPYADEWEDACETSWAREASEFAANLLMPLDDFRRQIPHDTKPSVDQISHLLPGSNRVQMQTLLHLIGCLGRCAH